VKALGVDGVVRTALQELRKRENQDGARNIRKQEKLEIFKGGSPCRKERSGRGENKQRLNTNRVKKLENNEVCK